MDRIKSLDKYSQVLLLVIVVMIVVFCSIYAVTLSREGYLYQDRILEPRTENGNTVYAADVDGKQWRITVTPDKTVSFLCGEKQYGPYTARKDSSAIPVGHTFAKLMTGVEVREGDEIIFCGGIYDTGNYWIMVNKDGTNFGHDVSVTTVNGTTFNSDGEIIDPMRPSVSKVLHLMDGPELSHKGNGFFCFFGVAVSLMAAVNILFADELFRWHFAFRTRDPDLLEPSDWEIAMRPVAWTITVLLALIVFLFGLQ